MTAAALADTLPPPGPHPAFAGRYPSHDAHSAPRRTSDDAGQQGQWGQQGRTAAGAPLHCMTGDAKAVADAIRRAALSARSKDFLLLLMEQTFGNAGWHRRRGQDEHACAFDLAEWTRRLEWHKPNVLRIRAALVALGVIAWEPSEAEPGRGRLAWNMALADWRPLHDDYRRARYARPHPAHPSRSTKLAGVSSLTTQTEPQASVSSLTDSKLAGVSSLTTVGPAGRVKLLTADGSDARPDAAPAAPVRKEGEKKKREQRAPAPTREAERPAERQEAEPPHVGDAELDAAMGALYALPGWRADRRLEWRLLEEMCGGGVGIETLCTPALLHYATGEFEAWLGRKAEAEAAEPGGRRRTRPDMAMFRRWLVTALADIEASYRRERAARARERAQRQTAAAARARGATTLTEQQRQSQEREARDKALIARLRAGQTVGQTMGATAGTTPGAPTETARAGRVAR